MSSIEIDVFKHEIIHLYKINSPMKLRFLMLRTQDELRQIKDAVSCCTSLNQTLKENIISDISMFLVFSQGRSK